MLPVPDIVHTGSYTVTRENLHFFLKEQPSA